MQFSHKATLGKTGFSLALLTVGGLAAIQPAIAQTYDAAKDFSATNNPNGVWSYGYENTLGGTLNLYTNQFAPASDIKGWDDNISLTDPLVQKNFGSQTEGYSDIVLQPGQLMFHPGPNDQFSIVRFTATQAGSYSLDSGFTPVTTNGTTTDVHVLEDGSSLFSGEVTGTYNAPISAPTFSDTLNLKAGDTVDFAVGYGTDGNFFDDSTGLTATLRTPAAVPEDSTTVSFGLLLVLGLGGLAFRARRRKAQAAE